MSVYAKIALGLCALGVLLMAGTVALLLDGGDEVSFGTGRAGQEGASTGEKDASGTPDGSTVEAEEAPGGETARESGGSDEAAVALPYYEMTREREAEGVRQFDVKTGASGEEQMRLIAEDMRSYAPEDGILLLDFIPESGSSGGTGFAMVFDSRTAVADPSLSYTEEEEEAIFEEDGGIRVVSYEQPAETDPKIEDLSPDV